MGAYDGQNIEILQGYKVSRQFSMGGRRWFFVSFAGKRKYYRVNKENRKRFREFKKIEKDAKRKRKPKDWIIRKPPVVYKQAALLAVIRSGKSGNQYKIVGVRVWAYTSKRISGQELEKRAKMANMDNGDVIREAWTFNKRRGGYEDYEASELNRPVPESEAGTWGVDRWHFAIQYHGKGRNWKEGEF